MIDVWYQLIGFLPFEWAHYQFMKNALLAVVLVNPLFALMGTIVVGNRMAFFSDVLGHSALTGIALGVLAGIQQPWWMMVCFIIVVAVAVNFFKGLTHASSDTVLGVFFAAIVAVGIVILSKGGGFNKFTTYLIGDILTVSMADILILGIMMLGVFVYWFYFGNALVLMSVNPVLARSRGLRVFLLETSFVIMLALVVAVSLRLVGILMINSLLILPAAASRLIARTMFAYTWIGVAVSVFSAVSGLILSYYWASASGATIVLCCAFWYFMFVVVTKLGRFRHA